jgi:hypothetical protein
MTNHAVLIPNKIAAQKVDSFLRPVTSASDIDNGNVFQLLTLSSTGGQTEEVFVATAPTSASATNCWMAGEPELPFATAGTNIYNGLGNIQDFYNSASSVFTAFYLQKGDIITLTSDALDSATAQAYAVPVLGTFKFAWAPAASTGLSLKYLKTTYIPCANGSAIGTGRITAFKFTVVGN